MKMTKKLLALPAVAVGLVVSTAAPASAEYTLSNVLVSSVQVAEGNRVQGNYIGTNGYVQVEVEVRGQTVPNAVVVKVGAGGIVSI